MNENPAITDLMAQYSQALIESAKLEAAAEHAENMVGVVKAEQLDTSLPEWKADAEARKSAPYKAALERRRIAKEAAGEARGRVEHIKTRIEVYRSRMAFERARMETRGG